MMRPVKPREPAMLSRSECLQRVETGRWAKRLMLLSHAAQARDPGVGFLVADAVARKTEHRCADRDG